MPWFYIGTGHAGSPTGLDRWISTRRSQWLLVFSGLVIGSTLYMMLFSSDFDRIGGRRQVNEDRQRDIDSWSRSQLYDYLSERQVYPDVDTPLEQVRSLVKSLQ